MISYELSLSLGVIPAIMCSGSLNFLEIVQQQKVCWNVIPLLPVAIAFFILILAETNRVPFDLPEAEAEIVAGYNIEYSGVLFALFFLGEYSSMILFSVFFCSCFFRCLITNSRWFFNIFTRLLYVIIRKYSKY